MQGNESSHDTTTWLRDQWSNPNDIFTILLIIGGDIVQVAIAQLCAGPVPYLTPVSFSFGWVTYAVSTVRSAVGENRLMPKPELDCILINAKSGYRRKNYSWVLSRMLRDFEFWRPAACDDIETAKLGELREENRRLPDDRRADDEDVKIGLRVTIWECTSAVSVGHGDGLYWTGLAVTVVQLTIAIVPWIIYDESLTFIATLAGTLLSYASGALPQWTEEKLGARKANYNKDVFLTEGNGAHDVVLILGHYNGLDLETLASAQRELRSPWTTRVLSVVLATLWLALLICVAGWSRHTWFLLGCGMVGMVHNVGAAGMARRPEAFGISLQYCETLVARKVMEVLQLLEIVHPRAGAALLAEFFPGALRNRETLLWAYAGRRAEAYEEELKTHKKAKTTGLSAIKPVPWMMPPLTRPEGLSDDSDIPAVGERGAQDSVISEKKDPSSDFVVQIQ